MRRTSSGRQANHRIRLLLTAFAFVFVIAIARAAWLQGAQHDRLAAMAVTQHRETIEIPAGRGTIYDRTGEPLAIGEQATTVYADPRNIVDPQRAAIVAAKALGLDANALYPELKDRTKGFVYVARKADPTKAEALSKREIPGLGFYPEELRTYPQGAVASHVLGFAGTDNHGLDGLERSLDKTLSGRPGFETIVKDPFGRAIDVVTSRPERAGKNVTLTIDHQIQSNAEQILAQTVRSYRARGGAAIVMDPRTGAILAMANYPTFNSNDFSTASPDARRNRAVTDAYEPGSTFKIVTASAALEQKLVKPNDWIDTNPGVIRFGARVIDEDKHHNYGVLTFTDVLVRSSNVGAIKIGLRVGAQRLGLYARRFGFGRPTSPDFPSESPGILWDPARQTESALASMSMGYQVGVTPLQMASAVSSVANGGELVQPRVIRAVIRDGVRKPVPRKVLGRTVDAATAAEVTSIMEAVIERGTGQTAQIDGYTVAGKTGTAQKVENGRYSNTDYNVSFVGFVPSRKPAFTIVVVVDSPHRVPPYGATVAAPIFQRIAAAALRQYGVPRSLNPAPPVLAVRRDADDVHEQPTSTAGVGPNIVTLAGGEHSAAAVFPDMRGLSARDALRMLARLGMTARLNGAGVVVKQLPEAGAPIDRESAATLWLERQQDSVP